LDVRHWFFKKRSKEDTSESDSFTLPLTQKEAIALARTIVVVCKSEQMDMAYKELLGTISNRLLRWTERQSAEQKASGVFNGLRLTPQELLGLMKNFTRIRTSDQIESADKEILEGISNRVGRWAERQGVWWNDGHKIITSVEQQID
jgi:hypothetical protein